MLSRGFFCIFSYRNLPAMQKIIAHITDTHIDDPAALSRGINPRQNLGLLLEDLVHHRPDEIVLTGDIGVSGTYSWVFDRLAEYNPGFRLTLGNHDNYAEAMKFYKGQSAGSNELYYTTEDDPYKYIYLDSSSGSLSNIQLQWLERELNTLKPIVVFIHHPILGLNTGMDLKYPLNNRDVVKALLLKCLRHVTIFCGHYHMPDKRLEGNLTQYITPAVSFQVKKIAKDIEISTPYFGYRVITFSSQGIRTQLATNAYDRFLIKAG